MDFSNPARRTILGGMIAAGVTAAAAGSAFAAPGSPNRAKGQTTMIGQAFEPRTRVRIGLIGLGNRGKGMFSGWTAIPGAEVVAVCDIRADRAKWAADRAVALGKPRPREFGGTADSYKEMLAQVELDLVYIATPWEDHYEQGRAALLAGAHAAVELPIATELEQLWDLVNVSETTRRHLLLAENCSYGRNELAMLRMAHEGLFGDVTHGAGGYLHDLRGLLFADGYYTDDWRRLWHTRSTASFYPMHGLAPVAAAMDINRGDRMATLAASATPAKGLSDYRARFVPRTHRSWNETYINGDQVTCMITTAQGRTIRAEHNVSAPRPYSRINSLVGSKGIMEDYDARVYFEPDHSGDVWQSFGAYRDKYDHWLWKTIGDDAAANGGHGGMDYVLQWRLVQQMRSGEVPDIDIYDSAAWCAPVPLSVASLAAGGKPVEIPDFTRGDWAKPRIGLDSRPSVMPPVA